jgi:hypothetical protein
MPALRFKRSPLTYTTRSEHKTLLVAVRSEKHHDPIGISEYKASEVLSANFEGQSAQH